MVSVLLCSQDNGADDLSVGNGMEPSPLRGAAGTVRHSDDVVALLQRSAAAAGSVQADCANPAAGGGGSGATAGVHRFTLFGSDITNRTAGGNGGNGERLMVRIRVRVTLLAGVFHERRQAISACCILPQRGLSWYEIVYEWGRAQAMYRRPGARSSWNRSVWEGGAINMQRGAHS